MRENYVFLIFNSLCKLSIRFPDPDQRQCFGLCEHYKYNKVKDAISAVSNVDDYVGTSRLFGCTYSQDYSRDKYPPFIRSRKWLASHLLSSDNKIIYGTSWLIECISLYPCLQSCKYLMLILAKLEYFPVLISLF
jgi:hypothetical protein